MTIKEMQEQSHATASAKGFHSNPREFGTVIALAHSELSEALEAHRNIKPFIKQVAQEYAVRKYVYSTPNSHPAYDTREKIGNPVDMPEDGLLCGVWSEIVGGKLVFVTAQAFMQTVQEYQKAAIAEELADVIIRVGDTAQEIGIDLQSAVINKMVKNAGRPYLHGGKAY